ncbi:AlpA family phage regulatory protein [Stenotrophomonas indicatrix]|uniref:helix-turn-helix transcriptional regulator n=1 Tax=Stenotrophomonas indicatrix TaxID=2045451 RepID=UPI0028EA26AB|nr:AlpA family phage regulatory protein [Stenotrophomonas indicatrix]MDT9581916.1 AlpA family phage regulatory protein [Stenotrophomonas indicatrix]
MDLLQIAHVVATARAGSSAALLLEHALEATGPSMGAAESTPEVVLKLEQVEVHTGMKKSYIYREMEKGTFPQRHKIGGGTHWLQSDIQRWIAARSNAHRWQPDNTAMPAVDSGTTRH